MSLIKLAGPIWTSVKNVGKTITKSLTPKDVRVKEIVRKNVDKAVGQQIAKDSASALVGQKAQAEFYNKGIRNLKIGAGITTGLVGLGAGVGGYQLGKRSKNEPS